VRFLAWNWHFFSLAVAGVDDVVRIYFKNSSAANATVLKVDRSTTGSLIIY